MRVYLVLKQKPMTDKKQLKNIKEDLEMALLVSHNPESAKFHLDKANEGLTNYDKKQQNKIKEQNK